MTYKQYWEQPSFPRDVCGFAFFMAIMFVAWPVWVIDAYESRTK